MMKKFLIRGTVLLAVIGIVACGEPDQLSAAPLAGQSEEPTNPYGAPPSEAPAAKGSPASRLTADYLQGAWCFSHYVAGDQKKEMNKTHSFNTDGTFLYQNNPNTDVDRPGNWYVEGQHLRIHPTMAGFNTPVKSVERDQFVLTGMGDVFFVRGACGGEKRAAIAAVADEAFEIGENVIYLNEQGDGVLRYTVPDGKNGEQYWYSIGGLTGSAKRPIEYISSGNGPLTGPDVSLYLWSMGQDIPLEKLVFSLDLHDPERNVAYFRFETDAEKAESREDCSPVVPIMECSE